MTYPNLPKAPIVEGLIQFQVKQNQGMSVETTKYFADKLKDRYKIAGELRDLRARLVLKQHPKDQPPAPPQPISLKHLGYRLERQDPVFIVHATVGELMVSRLKPYSNWEDLQFEMEQLWRVYCDICKPEAVTRVATRFINQLELPTENLDLEDYLTSPPSIPKKLPQAFEEFLTRIVIPHDETGARIAVSLATGTPVPVGKTLPIMLDIDVFKANLDLPVGSDEIWALLARMRDLKNKTFFSSVTEKALELFS